MDAIDILNNFEKDLNGCIAKSIGKAFTEIALHAKRESVRNAPRSPTQAQADRDKYSSARLKTVKAQRASRRKPTSHSRPKPGGLERSIKHEIRLDASGKWENDEAEIFVADDSEAAKYAFVIHSMKGMRWRERGAGTRAKGSRADEKFIERAIDENNQAYQTKIAEALSAAIDEYARKI